MDWETRGKIPGILICMGVRQPQEEKCHEWASTAVLVPESDLY